MKPIIISIIVGCGIIAFVGLIILISSARRLNSYELGIKYDNILKRLGDDVKNEGLHFGPPGFTFIIFPNVYNTMEFKEITCLNKDGVIIEIDVSYQFKANSKYMKFLVEQFKDFDGYKKVLLASGKSAVHDSCANFSTTEFQTDRGRFQELLRETMRNYCEYLRCELNDLQVNSVQRPSEFETAVKDKEAAKENIKVAENERPRLLLQAETKLEQAKKQAEIIQNNAETQAKIIINKAKTEAEALRYQYEKDLVVYKNIKSTQGLDNEGLISYMTIRAIAESKNEINMALKSPAKTSYSSITD
ncbi:SPFH domain band 7 family [Brachionus plicatilis]|uniref:Prohibitin n=1 Tax=Brachionus plicatilis TaxID=10195 RepID=A0A3M7QK30_BRAPC|nr:SPFH domain band 7 family [Brachionus plicatilis]